MTEYEITYSVHDAHGNTIVSRVVETFRVPTAADAKAVIRSRHTGCSITFFNVVMA